jgi:hypothetical protein
MMASCNVKYAAAKSPKSTSSRGTLAPLEHWKPAPTPQEGQLF